MDPFIKWHNRIHAMSALMVISLQALVYKYLYPFLTEYTFLSLFAAGGTYIFLYKTFDILYNLYLWKVFLKRYNIEGQWFHEFRSSQDPSYHRRGITKITQNALQTKFDGRNYDPEFDHASQITLWYDTHVNIVENDKLLLAYEATDYNGQNKRGMIQISLHSDEGKPTGMTGIFYDTCDPYRVGTVTWRRKVDWETSKIEHIF